MISPRKYYAVIVWKRNGKMKLKNLFELMAFWKTTFWYPKHEEEK
jgi:hypothetical protein